MDKFRLAVFNTQPPHLYRGGVERRINETTRRLTGEADISVYSGTKAGFKASTEIDGINFVPLNSTDKLYPLDNWTFNRTIAKTKIDADVYEAHNDNGYGLLKAFQQRGTKKPLVHTIHGVLADEFEQAKQNGYASFRGRVANRFMVRLARLEGETAQKADLIVTISRYSLEKIQKHYGVDPSKVRIVPNGVDPEKIKPSENQGELKRQFGLGDAPVVLFVGSLIPRKGISFLVEAAKQIVKTHADARFVIVGDGPLKPQLAADLAALNLTGNFLFKNGLTDETLAKMYGCADVFMLPSIQEGQGIVLLEASAAAKPVVAFDIGGVNEAVVNGETGLLVARGSSGELAEALLKLLGDADLRQKLGSAGRRFVVENYTWDICAQKMLAVYREALG
jgi:glycosyltransferase involved in cell wall biosynthesis